MSDHDGHRERLRQRYLLYGLDALPDVNALELLLGYAIPRQDTNKLAHRLIQTFGSMPEVFQASLEELTGRGGLSETTAALLRLTMDMAYRQRISLAQKQVILNNADKCGDYLKPWFTGLQDEIVVGLALDSKYQLLSCRRLFRGSVNTAGISVRQVLDFVLQSGADTLVLAHNHPKGLAFPSALDLKSTVRMYAALRLVGVFFADHLVMAEDGDYVSMDESGDMPTDQTLWDLLKQYGDEENPDIFETVELCATGDYELIEGYPLLLE